MGELNAGCEPDSSDSIDDVRIDAAGYVVRSRRRADLSQRELAQHLGVGRATVARWETGECGMRLDDLTAVLACAELRLTVVDATGRPVPPFDPDTVRDNAERRFPAHLDVEPPDQRPSNRGHGRRYDRPPARGWYALRPTRDEERVTEPVAARPTDHPTAGELAQRATELRARALLLGRRRVRPKPQPDCACPVGCFAVAGCLPDCPCRCEPVAATQLSP